MNYEDIMQIRYIPKIHNIHNQHKTNIINIIYIKYFSIHKIHIIHLIDIIIIICIIKFESLSNFHYVTYGLSLMCLAFPYFFMCFRQFRGMPYELCTHYVY